MNNKVYSIDEIREIINSKRSELAEVFNVSKIFVFGSYAKGEQSPESDIDFLVETSKPIGLFKFVDLKEYLEKLFDKKVDIGTPNGLKPLIKNRILSEAVSI